MGQFGGSLEPSTPMEFLCQSASSPTSHFKPDLEDALSNIFESNAAGVTNFLIV